jgi:hypothetical protein
LFGVRQKEVHGARGLVDNATELQITLGI